MKRCLAVLLLTFLSVLMIGCASSNRASPYPHPDLTNETWQQAIETNTSTWARGASRWFLTGDPNVTEAANMHAPYSRAMSTMQVRVPEFNNIRINAPFQVQLFGSDTHNSVFVYGPNAEVRSVAIAVRNNTLYINVAPNIPRGTKINNVIIRVGIVNLNNLVHLGSGRVEARSIRSNMLNIVSTNCGNIYMTGAVNLRSVTQSGTGCVSVFGAVTPVLDITTYGSGNVNVSGNLGIRSILHRGKGDINIIGANSDGLRVMAQGSGKVGLYGRMNLREVTASGNTCVFANYVNGPSVNAYATDQARIGLAGTTTNLYVNAARHSCFQGRYLCSENAYVRAEGSAHVNVTATRRIYASAIDSATVYFFGTPDLLSQFIKGNGRVIPIWFDGQRSCYIPTPVYKDGGPVVRPYKDMPVHAVRTVKTVKVYHPRTLSAPVVTPQPYYQFRRKGSTTTTTYTGDM